MPSKKKYVVNVMNTAFALSVWSIVIVCLFFPLLAFADSALLKKYIVEYNLEKHHLSLSDATYRGEEGILRINPEVGKSFGFNVLINQDYLKAMELYEEAGALFEKVTEVMSTRNKEKFPGEHIKKIEKLALRHNEVTELAWEHMLTYRSQVTAEVDDRLNKDISVRFLEKLLRGECEKNSYNLRNALGYFYNRCQNFADDTPLNQENIEFVNYVFYEFTKNATAKAMNQFDLDRCNNKEIENSWTLWKYALGNSSARYALIVEDAFERIPQAKKYVDVLLFLALMRQESNFDPQNVSYVGAAGLTQIMPRTAKGLGMKEIFSPPYFKEAGSLLGRERRLKRKAKDLIPEVTALNSAKLAKQAREMMQESLSCANKRKKLYDRYKRELLKSGRDDRLNPQKATEYGLKYFVQMMKIQKRDISLALASYNAGAHRVRQYNGIPPFDETIDFRNRVLKYYRIYQARAETNRLRQAKTQKAD